MDYHDYVIKDGKFIGKFESLYEKFDDPWDQAKAIDNLSKAVVIDLIKKNNIKSMVEFGCGLGHSMNHIYEETNVNLLGIDISKTSIIKARKNYPNLNFAIDNINNICNYHNYDCYFFSEVTWYILENKLIDNIFKKMISNLKGKYFIHNLTFYKGQQKYGNNYFTNLDEFVDFCPFELITKVEIDYAESNAINTSSIFKI